METHHPGAPSRRHVWLGVALLVVGLLGHILAAHGTGGRPVDYQHHVIGFFLIALVTAPIVALVAWRFWKGRNDITLLVFGVIQALAGILIYLQRFWVATSW